MDAVQYDFRFDSETPISALNYFADKVVEPYFHAFQGTDRAVGSGANKQVYMEIASQLVSDSILLQKGFFVDVNPNHDFWSSGTASFCHYIRCFLEQGCIFPYHFAPSLLEVIAKGTTMDISDLQFYLDKIDPDVAQSVANTDFAVDDTGHDSKADAYRSLCIGEISAAKRKIYQVIREHMYRLLPKRRRSPRKHPRSATDISSLRKLDDKLSGPYVLTPSMVLQTITCSDDYRQMLSDFVNTLTDAELRSMLLTLGNTLSLNTHYSVCIGEALENIQISVCSGFVFLPRKLFEDDEGQELLKAYFAETDTKISG